MAASLRVYRQRIRSVTSTKKITRAMELIAASRIAKAQAAVNASKPYALQITRVISALASQRGIDHPLVSEAENPTRAAILVITSDRGLAGGYSSNAIKAALGVPTPVGPRLRGQGGDARAAPVYFLSRVCSCPPPATARVPVVGVLRAAEVGRFSVRYHP